ncbi:hypothetical protein EH30_02645 [Erythrobacter sp. JL475]|nr:hypothetical protein EH30_02645 [Erythrobacter sp. JL475]
MLRKIERSEVALGMFIVQFGGSWFNHPFWRSRFLIESGSDLEKVRRSSVPWVMIDDELGVAMPQPPSASDAGDPEPGQHSRIASSRRRPPVVRSVRHDPAIANRRRATALVSRSKDVMRRVYDDVRMGWSVNRAGVDGVVEEIVHTVGEDAKTLLSVTRLKTKDDYTYLHSVAVCTLMICIARHRGLDEATVRDLGLAGLLHDIGKIGIPDPILNKPDRLTDPEFEIVRNHPEHGFQLLAASPGISPTALDVCRHHHEKIDGTGYPFGLSGDQISLAARMGAVCDVFDALTSQRIYKQAWSAQAALTRMWRWRGHFDREMLADLMLVLHVFAEGLLVKLSDGRLALTLALAQDGIGQSVPLVAFHCGIRNAPITPRRLRIRSGDADLRVTSVEDPSDWGFADWDNIRAQILAGQTPVISQPKQTPLRLVRSGAD